MYNTQFEQWREEYLNGKVLLIDKPLTWTSFDAVKKIRILTGVSKVGHAGTLDPLATGLLIICTGKFTKKINEYMAAEKEYTGTFTLGATTPTYDLESVPVPKADYSNVSSEMIMGATQQFTGTIMQIPPAHSAIKKSGTPAYVLARKGKEVKMDPRPITISLFEITKIDLPLVHFKVVCSTGTYIRSLANDFGEALGCGAYLSSLRRTRIGMYNVQEALSIESFVDQIQSLKKT
ncbi:MAG: tRNA pseudouridine(55) synthase TruB [Bacteroidota bacterium]|jgi:tRNA pseudouridine55 synthase|nr:tRNA pseudouridine(55) synthase TruB [Chitinophagaceae bacterium]